jgi:lysyl-tRNA synthetase class I
MPTVTYSCEKCGKVKTTFSDDVQVGDSAVEFACGCGSKMKSISNENIVSIEEGKPSGLNVVDSGCCGGGCGTH